MASKARVLVVDDERLVRMNLQLVFGREGYRVDTAESCSRAHDLLDLHHYDLLCTDLSLPDGSGLSLVEHIRVLDPTAVAVVMTASETPDLSKTLERTTGVTLIPKPFQLRSMVREAKEIIRRRQDRTTP